MAKLFLSYAREDKKHAETLYAKLISAGLKPFMDIKDIYPGEDWALRIRKEIKNSDFFLALISNNSTNKRGYLQKEIRLALDEWDYMLESDIYLIPVRLESCEVPERLSYFQWVDLFAKDGFNDLLRAIQVGKARRYVENPIHKIKDIEKVKLEGHPNVAKINYPVSIDFMNIPAGNFYMGSSPSEKSANKDERPQSFVFLDSYWISKFPITNEQFEIFVKDTNGRIPSSWSIKSIPLGKNNHPVTGISWREALEFCQWLSLRNSNNFRLPTEAEWEKSARGADGRIYPWGNRWSKSKTNSIEGNINETTRVGAYSPQGDSPYGIVDMAGNVWEWCSTIYKPYSYRHDDGREELNIIEHRVIRGGSFSSNKEEVRCAYRNQYAESFRHGYIGFRVVKIDSK